MSTPKIDPIWGDDWMAIADAAGVNLRPHPELSARFVTHPSIREEFTDLALELRLREWCKENVADAPVALVPTDHASCTACGETLCGCEIQCEEFQRDACSHYGQPYCYSCAPHNCPDCRGDQDRWDRR